MDGGSIVQHAIKAAFSEKLASDFPPKLGSKVSNESDARVQVDQSVESSMPGVFMVGYTNS